MRPVSEPDIKFNCRVKYFPGDKISIACFSKPIFNPYKAELHGKEKKPFESLKEYNPETGEMAYKFVEGKTILCPFTGKYVPLVIEKRKKNNEIRSDSIKRAIDKAFEIGLANDFQYFITLTLDETKIDRYDTKKIYKKLRDWLSNRVKRNQMDYILFPEYHKLREGETERAIHFHGLINAQNLTLTNSGRTTKNGQVIYNLDNWKYGFSTAIELDGSPAVVSYVTKYITKDNTRIFGKTYFSGGRTLKREVPTDYMNKDYVSFDGQEYFISSANMSVKYKVFNLDFDIPGEEDEFE
ncbi:hypothetical protein D7Y09_13605 [bacterium 1XD42-1]|nr:hypothetical protein D7X25_13945 [bacterium 1XD42-8]RKJ62514.1 hypothetical protein D7Y09_13605 [bacterium 1XD42-1]